MYIYIYRYVLLGTRIATNGREQCIILYNRAKLFLKALDNIIISNKRNGQLRFWATANVFRKLFLFLLFERIFDRSLTTFFALILTLSRLYIARHIQLVANLLAVFDFSTTVCFAFGLSALLLCCFAAETETANSSIAITARN